MKSFYKPLKHQSVPLHSTNADAFIDMFGIIILLAVTKAINSCISQLQLRTQTSDANCFIKNLCVILIFLAITKAKTSISQLQLRTQAPDVSNLPN